MPYTKEYLESKGAQFRYNTDYKEIMPGAFLTGEVPRKTSFEKGDENQVIKSEGKYIKDPLLDDQSLIFDHPEGLIIILGCSHAGIINILNYAIEKTGRDQIHTIIGGTHLGLVKDEQKERSIEELQKFNIKCLGVSHCTGVSATQCLAQVFGDRLFTCHVGTVLEV